MATEIEAQTVRWIAELIGFPTDARRAAGERRQHGELRLLPRRARREGRRRTCARTGLRSLAAPLRVYASTETHTWIQKAADLFGLGTDAIRWIPADDQQRMDVDALEQQIVADRQNGDVAVSSSSAPPAR